MLIIFPQDAIAYQSTQFGQGTTASVFLDNVACVGNESRLVDCNSTTAVTCTVQDAAGVGCNRTRK